MLDKKRRKAERLRQKVRYVWLNHNMQYNSIYPEAGYPDRQLSGSAWPFY